MDEHCVELKRVFDKHKLVYKVQLICYKTLCFRRGIQICLLPQSRKLPASSPGRTVKTQAVPEQIGPLQLAIHVVQNRRAGEQKSHWDKTNRKLPFTIIYAPVYVFYLSCPSATFALQRGGFVPREELAAKGLFKAQDAQDAE